MRKALSCVLMMTLLLAACGGSGESSESPEELAARIRAEYLSLTGWTAEMEIHADYGERVYDFTLDAAWEKDGETVLTVVEPELIAGIVARVGKDEAYLEYDGISLSTGPLTGDGLDPLEAVPFLMEQIAQGYMAQCSFETEGEARVLKVCCREPEAGEGAGRECALYFDPDSHDLLRAELSWDGFTALTVTLTDFAKEMSENGQENGPDLG